jgi:hypothetical protein
MHGLDILTPRGQQTLVDEAAAAAIWERANPGFAYITTPKDTASSIDAVLVRDGSIQAIAETKCRYGLTLDQFRGAFGGEWLVTMDKLVSASRLAAGLCVPLYGFLYLADEGVLLTQRITDSTGQFVVRLRCENTATQKTVNGGSVVRANAFIDMSQARQWNQ